MSPGRSCTSPPDGEGRWRDALAGRPLPGLDGCIDVDIGITPATNTLPILRLALAAGDSREISAAYVPLPEQIEDGFLPQPAALYLPDPSAALSL